jgi:glutaredoxin-related protein
MLAYRAQMRTVFDPAKVHPAVAPKIESYKAELLAEAARAVAENDVVVLGMSQNPFPGRACKLLDAEGIKYRYLEYGSYLGRYRDRLVFKMWTGWPTFPMIFVKQTFVGGFEDLKRLAESGELKKML